MRLLSTLVVVSLVWSGCAKRPALITAGVSASFTGLMVVGIAATAHESGGDAAGMGFAMAGIFSGLFTLAALVDAGIAGAIEDHDAEEHETKVRAAKLQQLEQVKAQMQNAEAAARGEDCPQVIRLDDQVCTLAPELHDSMFVRDAAIAHCIAVRSCTTLAQQQRDLARQQQEAKANAEHEACGARRARMLHVMATSSDVDVRKEILSSLPDCEPSANKH